MHSEDADQMANSAALIRLQEQSLFWVYTIYLFVETGLPKNLGLLQEFDCDIMSQANMCQLLNPVTSLRLQDFFIWHDNFIIHRANDIFCYFFVSLRNIYMHIYIMPKPRYYKAHFL